MKNQILLNVGILKLEKVVKSQILAKVGIMKLENSEKRKPNENWNENRILYFKFVKNNTAFNNSLLQWRLLDLLGMAQLFN